MANIIKIKRSTSTAAPTGLNEGELAVSFLSGKLFVGNTTASIPIGGIHSPGTLTANQALVANSTSSIDKVIVANLVPSSIWANGAAGTAGQLLTSNSTGGVHWAAAAVTTLDGLSDVTITAVANNEYLVYDGVNSIWVNKSISGTANQVTTTFVGNALTISLPAYVIVNTALSIGNSTVNTVINSTSVSASNLAATNSITVGSNVTVNTTGVSIGNSTVNSFFSSTSIFIGANASINATSVAIGNTTANSIINSTAVSATSLLVGSNVTVNTSGVSIGNSTVNSFFSSDSILIGANASINTTAVIVGNSTVNTVVNSTAISTGSGTFSGAVSGITTLAAGNTTITGFANVTSSIQGGGTLVIAGAASGITTLAAGNTTITGFANITSTANVGGNINARGTLTVNGALTVGNSAGLGNTTITGDLNITGNTTIGDSNTDSITITSTVAANIVPIANGTTTLGITGSRWQVFANTVTASNGQFADLSVTGNLTVTGTLTTIATTNLTITDPLIKLANNNSADISDIGLYGQYTSSGVKYSALYRENTTGIFKLYGGLTVEPTTTVDLTGGTLAPLTVGSLVASSISLTTVLPVSNGGSGAGTFTAKGVIYGNGTSALQVTGAGTDGQVLQANSTGFPVYSDLDGGSF